MGLAKFFDRSSPYWRSIIVVVAASGVALSFVGWQIAHEREDRLARQDFDARATDHLLALQSGVDQYINDMLALRAAFQTFQPDRAQFQSFAEQLFDDKNAILAASWSPRITREERAEHERRAVEDGLVGYQVRSIAPDGTLSVAPEAPEYFPILFNSKIGASAAVYGLNLLDGGLRQQALERARDEDRPAATSIFELRRGEGDRNGFVIALPVYRAGAPHDTLEDRRRNLIGVVQGVFQASVLVNTILESSTTPAGLDLYFFAGKPAADSLPFYVHQSRLYDGQSPSLSFADLERGLHWSGTLRIADRDWTCVAVPRPGGIGTPSHLGSWVFLFGSLALTGMVAAYLWTVGRNASRLEASNRALDRAVGDLDAVNARLREQNSRFDTAINNISQALAFFDGERRLIVCNRRLIEMYRLPPEKIVPGDHLGRDPRSSLRGRHHTGDERGPVSRLAQFLCPVRQVQRHHGRARRRPRHPHPQAADAGRRLGGDARGHHRATAGRTGLGRGARTRGTCPAGRPSRSCPACRSPGGGARRHRADGCRRSSRSVEQAIRRDLQADREDRGGHELRRHPSRRPRARPIRRCHRPRGGVARAAARSASAAVQPVRTTPVDRPLHRRRRASHRGRRQHRHPHGRHRNQGARGVVPAAVQQQSGADAGDRCRYAEVPRRQRSGAGALRIFARAIPRDDGARHPSP